jgi:hypothetical protein
MSHDDHSNHTEVTTPDKQEVNQLKSVLIITFVKRRILSQMAQASPFPRFVSFVK